MYSIAIFWKKNTLYIYRGVTMRTDKVELAKSRNFDNSKFMSEPKDSKKEEESNYFLEMKKEDIEQKRASQRYHNIYRLSLKAKHGDCSAIKKLINYNFENFSLDSSYAQKLNSEAGEMLSEQQNLYSDSAGELTDNAQKAALEEVQKNNEYKNETEREEQVNELMDRMTCGLYSI